jgi:hypothetical protein
MLQCGAARLSLLLRAAAAGAATPRRGAASRLASALAAPRGAAARSSSALRMASPAAAAPAAVDADDDGPPLFTFAVMSDVQYADIPDGASFGGTPRYYRHSLEALRCAPARPSCVCSRHAAR